MCEVTAKRALLNYAIIQDFTFDVGQVIEDSILYNKDATMNLGHPFLIYGFCKKARVPLESNETWIHQIKAIVVKKNKSGVQGRMRYTTPRMNPRTRKNLGPTQ